VKNLDNNFKKYEESAELLKAIAHPVRLCIIRGLLEKGVCNVTTMQGCLGIPQPTVSRHLQVLKGLGIIEGERNGLEIKYRITNQKIVKLIHILLNDIE
jgi:ArsR family transcriptional regulator